MSDEKKSLAEQMRAKKEAEEAKSQSLADRMRAKKAAEAAADDEPKSLADKMRTMADSALPKEKESAPKAAATKPGAQLLEGDEIEAVTLSEAEELELDSKIAALGTQYKNLVGRVKLSSVSQEISRLNNAIEALPAKIAEIRSKGYVYQDFLESKTEVFRKQWQQVNAEVSKWVESESPELVNNLSKVETLLGRIDSESIPGRKAALAQQVEGVFNRLTDKVEAAENSIQGFYDKLKREIDHTESQLNKISWYLEEWGEASFDKRGGESIYAVAKAEWDDGRDKPDGILFLSNQRLIFEQKEKTGKRLGMFGGKEVQEMLWEAPVDSVEDVVPENKGMLGGKDMLNLSLGSGAPYAAIVVEVKGGVSSKWWAQQIKRMASGQANDERAIEPDPELIERVRNAPTECPVCGAMLSVPAVGDSKIECGYCGKELPL